VLLDRVERPDAVLYDIGGFAGRVAAHRWGVPAVQLSPTYVAWEGYEEDMAEHTAALKTSPSGRRYFATLRTWLDDNDVALDADAFLGRPEACVVLIPRVLQPNADRVGPRYVFAGPCIDGSRTLGWVPTDGDDRPLVYVSFGTAYTDHADIYRLCIRELAGSYRLVIATGKVDPTVLGPLPDGVQVARTQPQLDVLAHASAFITHAGMGGAVESLWLGVPTVAIPQAVDQFTNAAKLDAIGAGVQLLAKEVDSESLCAAVAAALARKQRALELRAEVRRRGRRGGRRRRRPAPLRLDRAVTAREAQREEAARTAQPARGSSRKLAGWARDAMAIRFQALIVAIAKSRLTSSSGSKWAAAAAHASSGTWLDETFVTASVNVSAARSRSSKYGLSDHASSCASRCSGSPWARASVQCMSMQYAQPLICDARSLTRRRTPRSSSMRCSTRISAA